MFVVSPKKYQTFLDSMEVSSLVCPKCNTNLVTIRSLELCFYMSDGGTTCEKDKPFCKCNQYKG